MTRTCAAHTQYVLPAVYNVNHFAHLCRMLRRQSSVCVERVTDQVAHVQLILRQAHRFACANICSKNDPIRSNVMACTVSLPHDVHDVQRCADCAPTAESSHEAVCRSQVAMHAVLPTRDTSQFHEVLDLVSYQGACSLVLDLHDSIPKHPRLVASGIVSRLSFILFL